MNGASEEEIARLANRLAMLVSDDGEADNAGRAVGALARRLGLSGGQLKAIFVAGAESAGVQTAQLAAQSSRIGALEAEVAALRESLRVTEATARGAMAERDALRREGADMAARLLRRRRGRLLSVLLVLLIAAAGAVGWRSQDWLRAQLAAAPPPPAATPGYREAVVHDAAAVLRAAPEETAAAVVPLPAGTRLLVRRVFWHNLEQWVEVEFQGRDGYVPSTSVDLS